MSPPPRAMPSSTGTSIRSRRRAFSCRRIRRCAPRMIASMINGEPDPEDLRKFFRALKRAQHDIDLRPELYTHYYKKEFPVRYHARMDTRRWGPGERIVFEPYTKDSFTDAREWIAEHGMFPDGNLGNREYEQSVVRLM